MILHVGILQEVGMPDFEINEPVMTPIGIASYQGAVQLHGQRLVVVTFQPPELLEVDRRSRGFQLVNSIPECLVQKIVGAL
jgi:hypothetical protein